MSAEVSCSPQPGFSLTDQVENRIRELVRPFVVDVSAMAGKIREVAGAIVADISAQYEQGLTKQVALLHVDCERLLAECNELRERQTPGQAQGETRN